MGNQCKTSKRNREEGGGETAISTNWYNTCDHTFLIGRRDLLFTSSPAFSQREGGRVFFFFFFHVHRRWGEQKVESERRGGLDFGKITSS